MGLDMYIERYPKVGISPRIVDAIEEIEEAKKHGCSLKNWCGVDESELPIQEVIDLIESFRHTSYSAWDAEKKYPHNSISDQVAYWRKENAIHNWFVNHVQDGIDDCDHHLVKKDDLELLKIVCREVLDKVKLVFGEVKNGKKLEDGKWVDILEDGWIVGNPEVCEDLLPTQDGFFFGGTQYNEWYVDGIRKTFDICDQLLKETDFGRYELYYRASW